jgi:hypothetical protein
MPRYQPTHGPGHYPNEFDLTGHVGPLMPELQGAAQWPMYSFDRPSLTLWNAIGKRLHEGGWPDEKIREWLQSRQTRWALDGTLGDAIETLGTEYAERMLAGEQT